MLMSGEGRDEKKENALKTALDYLDGFLAKDNYIAGSFLTIADLSILASITQLEAMDYKLTGYKFVFTSNLQRVPLESRIMLSVNYWDLIYPVFFLFFFLGIWSWLADKLHFNLSYEAGLYKSSKSTLPFAGLQHMQQCQVNISTQFLLQAFDPNEWCLKMVFSVGV
jgi:hypothetical protein